MDSDLPSFIARHARAYDAATDDYRRPPFAAPVKAGKNTPIYNAHSYHTKVPPQGIVPYIEHYTDPGDLVLDPFCGSGMTGVAALMTGRPAILSDLSPAAVHIARNYCTPVDVVVLRQEVDRIKSAVREEFDWLYGTTCDRCGASATILNTIWSDVCACGRCGAGLVLWDLGVDHDTGQFRDTFNCPTCGAEVHKAQVRWQHAVPVITRYECSVCTPSRGEHLTTEGEKEHITEVERTPVPYWHPSDLLDTSKEQYMRDNLKGRGVFCASDFYTHRNLWALARLWAEISKSKAASRESLRFWFTSFNWLATRMYRYRESGGGGQQGRLTVPSLSCERNVWSVAEGKWADIGTYLEQLGLRQATVLARVLSATSLESVGIECIDYVFTDPPFGMNLYYSDLNFLWESWLQEFTDSTEEAIVNRAQKIGAKTVNDYARLMTESFQEMHRVLKPGRWASVVFHNSDDKIWQAILDAAEAAGFELAEVNAFDKEQLSFKGIRGQKGLERVTNKDVVLNLRKPKPGEKASINGKVYADEMERRIVEAIAVFLDGNPALEDRTLQGLWNRALFDMLREGSVHVSMAQVGEMLPYYFKEIDACWYLRGDAVQDGNVFDLNSDAGAITWLTAVLANGPQTVGDLITSWQQETAHLGTTNTGRLDRLLLQNFWQDAKTGRWRVPSPAEREKMSNRQSLADEAHLRVVRRFLKGELDRLPPDIELSEWLRFCYRRESYAEAEALFSHIHPERLEPDRYKELKKIVAVCRQKTAIG
jgi:DNA modification methylase